MKEITKQEFVSELNTLQYTHKNSISIEMKEIDSMISDSSKIYRLVDEYDRTDENISVNIFYDLPLCDIKGVFCHFQLSSEHDMPRAMQIVNLLEQYITDETDMLFSLSYQDNNLSATVTVTTFAMMTDKLNIINNINYKV